jgi:hypothetical protein
MAGDDRPVFVATATVETRGLKKSSPGSHLSLDERPNCFCNWAFFLLEP